MLASVQKVFLISSCEFVNIIKFDHDNIESRNLGDRRQNAIESGSSLLSCSFRLSFCPPPSPPIAVGGTSPFISQIESKKEIFSRFRAIRRPGTLLVRRIPCRHTAKAVGRGGRTKKVAIRRTRRRKRLRKKKNQSNDSSFYNTCQLREILHPRSINQCFWKEAFFLVVEFWSSRKRRRGKSILGSSGLVERRKKKRLPTLFPRSSFCVGMPPPSSSNRQRP